MIGWRHKEVSVRTILDRKSASEIAEAGKAYARTPEFARLMGCVMQDLPTSSNNFRYPWLDPSPSYFMGSGGGAIPPDGGAVLNSEPPPQYAGVLERKVEYHWVTT